MPPQEFTLRLRGGNQQAAADIEKARQVVGDDEYLHRTDTHTKRRLPPQVPVLTDQYWNSVARGTGTDESEKARSSAVTSSASGFAWYRRAWAAYRITSRIQ